MTCAEFGLWANVEGRIEPCERTVSGERDGDHITPTWLKCERLSKPKANGKVEPAEGDQAAA